MMSSRDNIRWSAWRIRHSGGNTHPPCLEGGTYLWANSCLKEGGTWAVVDSILLGGGCLGRLLVVWFCNK